MVCAPITGCNLSVMIAILAHPVLSMSLHFMLQLCHPGCWLFVSCSRFFSFSYFYIFFKPLIINEKEKKSLSSSKSLVINSLNP